MRFLDNLEVKKLKRLKEVERAVLVLRVERVVKEVEWVVLVRDEVNRLCYRVVRKRKRVVEEAVEVEELEEVDLAVKKRKWVAEVVAEVKELVVVRVEEAEVVDLPPRRKRSKEDNPIEENKLRSFHSKEWKVTQEIC
jgi:hypothetical protein